jgi:hypothetical protein
MRHNLYISKRTETNDKRLKKFDSGDPIILYIWSREKSLGLDRLWIESIKIIQDITAYKNVFILHWDRIQMIQYKYKQYSSLATKS